MTFLHSMPLTGFSDFWRICKSRSRPGLYACQEGGIHPSDWSQSFRSRESDVGVRSPEAGSRCTSNCLEGRSRFLFSRPSPRRGHGKPTGLVMALDRSLLKEYSPESWPLIQVSFLLLSRWCCVLRPFFRLSVVILFFISPGVVRTLGW